MSTSVNNLYYSTPPLFLLKPRAGKCWAARPHNISVGIENFLLFPILCTQWRLRLSLRCFLTIIQPILFPAESNLNILKTN